MRTAMFLTQPGCTNEQWAKRIPTSIVFAILASAVIFSACSRPDPTSLLIANAVIMDGSGEPGFSGSVRIDGDRIIAVGDLSPLRNEDTLDAGGLVLAPGFIDTHSHHDSSMSEYRDMPGVVTQGITTIVRGADGGDGVDEAYTAMSQEEFNRRFNESPVSVNIASFSPHNSIRSVVMGSDFKRFATAEELAEMSALVEADMQHGALGLGTGLEYMPGIFSATEEVIELSKIAASYGGHYMSHVRDEDDKFLDAVDEVIRIGREATSRFTSPTSNSPTKRSGARLTMSLINCRPPATMACKSAPISTRIYTGRATSRFCFRNVTTPTVTSRRSPLNIRRHQKP